MNKRIDKDFCLWKKTISDKLYLLALGDLFAPLEIYL